MHVNMKLLACLDHLSRIARRFSALIAETLSRTDLPTKWVVALTLLATLIFVLLLVFLFLGARAFGLPGAYECCMQPQKHIMRGNCT